MKNLLFFLFLIISGAPFAYASELPLKNAGFVPANIWYSKDPFFAGETIRVYTIIFNGSAYDLTGGVEFLDNGTVIGKTNFSLAGGGRTQDVWVDWKAGQGAHTISARLVNVIADGPSGKQAVSLENVQTGKSERSVDVDPNVAAKESAAQLQKVTDAKNQAIGKIEGVANTVGESIPAPIKESVSFGATTLEKFRVSEGFQLQIAKEKKIKDIDIIKAKEKASTTTGTATSTTASKKSTGILDTVSNATEKPFAYAMLAILALLQYFFQWQVLFYGIILYALYRLIKWVVWKIRNR